MEYLHINKGKCDYMRIRKLDVVELKNKNRATILTINKGKKYFAEIVKQDGETIERKQIELKQIQKIVYTRQLDR